MNKQIIKGGKIILIIGPMWGGKSTKLLEVINRYNIKKMKTCIVKYSLDDRYSGDNKILTHDM